MCGAAACLDLQPDEPLVRERKAKLGRLGDDRRVGDHGASNRFRADAAGFLVGDGGDDHVAGESLLGGIGSDEHDRRQTALHVICAASVEAIAFEAWLEAVDGAGDGDRVHVCVEDQRAPATRATGTTDHVGPARPEFLYLDVEAMGVQPAGDEAGELGLPRSTGNEGRVDGVDRNQLLE